jgi:hypothetical protein
MPEYQVPPLPVYLGYTIQGGSVRKVELETLFIRKTIKRYDTTKDLDAVVPYPTLVEVVATGK